MLNTDLLHGNVPLGIALSGGSDSTALLVLAVDAFGAENLQAITIDHSLRAAAQAEARQAAKLCASLGVPHTTRTLALKDGPNLQARARNARYMALGDWARAQLNSISAIALGHTKDDVSETFLMRLARGSGVDGLATMPEYFQRAGMVFKRPLLAASRAELQVMLNKRGIKWSEDPSNQDPRFTRVKMRQAQTTLDTLGLYSDRLSQTADWMRAASEVLNNAADNWIKTHAYTEYGDVVLDLKALRIAPKETAFRVLTRALSTLSGNPYRPRFSALSELLHSDVARTLEGCLIYHHKGTLRLTREVNAIENIEHYWQINGPLAPSHRITPLGENGLKQCDGWRNTALLPRRSLLSTPAIWLDGALVAAPIARPSTNWKVRATIPLHLAK
ncbi:tRNA lysidine(34) synthetase TilS [Planktotalea sp.]|uniref:tRNA lysidine(34) synthetase TilS n=1 Tax=Planktotalea sp. TaxID=2029877 RepID=UPI0025F3C11E|nr:tRNA lysidine(34) synthetase TilS [Planktotalea sp.]